MMMMARASPAEQLKEYQARSKNNWATISFLSSTSNLSSYSSSWLDVILVICELLVFALLVFSVAALYLKYMRLAFSLICVTALLYMCMRITKEERQHRKSKRRMLLPLSM